MGKGSGCAVIAPAVSVVVPNYNHARFLRARIEGILGQTFQDFEIILLDDGSTDDSVSLLRSYAQHPKVAHVVINKHNTGSACAQWARGIELAAGEFIWIAESDDLADPRLLEVLCDSLRQYPNAVLAYSRSVYIDETGQQLAYPAVAPHAPEDTLGRFFTITGRDMLRQYLRHYNVIPNASAVLFRRSAAVATRIPTNYRFCGDWLFWARLLATGDAAYSLEPLNFFRCHGSTTRAAQSWDAKRRRITEVLRVIHEVHHDILKDEIPPSFSKRWFVDEWQSKDTSLPWFVLSTPGISPRLRIGFFIHVLKWRAWWTLELLTRWLPGRRGLYQRFTSNHRARPAANCSTRPELPRV